MITSTRNPKVRLVRDLLGRSKERREAGAFVVEGVRLLEEGMRAAWPMRFVLIDGTLSERGKSMVEEMRSHGVDLEEISRSVMESISETETPQGILAVLDDFQIPIPAPLDFVLIPDQIREPGNLGTLLRSAAATGVQAVLIPPDTTDAFAPKVLRAGMGAHFRLPIRAMGWEKIEELTKDLQVLIAEKHGNSCWEMDLRQPLALVIGSEAEGAGLSARKIADGRIGIPITGSVESLNAGVAGSVLMFETIRQRSQQ
ncbi:MAG: RNA methyltransferase [Chloroflexi bacterium]|nr:RNA methyltransferase [Chloroflexota bacterium]